MDYLENFNILELQVGLLSPNQDPFLPPFPHSPLPGLNMPSCSPKSTLNTFSLISPTYQGTLIYPLRISFRQDPIHLICPVLLLWILCSSMVQEPDITVSNKEIPASILPSISSYKNESQLQQISAEKPFSPASKTAENTTLDSSTHS